MAAHIVGPAAVGILCILEPSADGEEEGGVLFPGGLEPLPYKLRARGVLCADKLATDIREGARDLFVFKSVIHI